LAVRFSIAQHTLQIRYYLIHNPKELIARLCFCN
jgi:hypothetical protein